MSHSPAAMTSSERSSLAEWSAGALNALVLSDRDAATARFVGQPLALARARWLIAQRLGPFVYHHLHQMELTDALPGDARSALHQDYYLTIAQTTLYTHELFDLLADLRQQQIEPVVLKGIVLGHTIYPSSVTRPISDIDLLITPEQLETVSQVFRARSYQDEGLKPERHREVSSALNIWREFPDGQKLAIEAHWQLFHESTYRFIDLTEIRSRVQPLEIGGQSIQALDSIDQLIHACGHLLLHHSQSWLVVWLLDLRLMIERSGSGWDWAEVMRRAQSAQLAGALVYWLTQAEMWCGPFLSEQIARSLDSVTPAAEESRYLAVARVSKLYTWQLIWLRARGAGGWRPALIYLRDLLFPPWSYMQYRYHVCSRWLAPIYYARRLVRAALIALRHTNDIPNNV